MYSDDLLEHAEQDMPSPQGDENISESNSCGDHVAVRSTDPLDLAVDGCLICRAAASKSLDLHRDDTVHSLSEMDETTFLDHLGWEISPTREDCALTVLRAIRQA